MRVRAIDINTRNTTLGTGEILREKYLNDRDKKAGDEQLERDKKKEEKERIAREKARAERERNMSAEDRARRIVGVGTQTAQIVDQFGNAYARGSDVYAAGQSAAEQALSQAVTDLQNGVDAQTAIQKLSEALSAIGAVIPRFDKVISEIEILKKQFETMDDRINRMR